MTKLEKFLRENGLQNAFRKNIVDKDPERFIFLNGDNYHAIVDAFVWDESPEGFDYWSLVSANYQDSMHVGVVQNN